MKAIISITLLALLAGCASTDTMPSEYEGVRVVWHNKISMPRALNKYGLQFTVNDTVHAFVACPSRGYFTMRDCPEGWVIHVRGETRKSHACLLRHERKHISEDGTGFIAWHGQSPHGGCD